MSLEESQGSPATWKGPYDTWSEAEAIVAADSGNGTATEFESVFALEAWLTRQREFREALVRGDMPLEAVPCGRNSTLPLLVQGLDELRILDFGGGSGWVSDLLRNASLPVSKYVVLDGPEVCSYFSQGELSLRRFVPLEHWRSLQADSDSFQVLYCNSSLQYAKSNDLLVQVAQGLHPRWILLDDTLVTQSPADSFAIQLNSDRPQAVRLLSVLQLVRDMLAIGYKLLFRAPFVQPGYRNWAATSDEGVLATRPMPETLLFVSM